MKKFDLEIHDNKLKTKADLQEAFKQLTDPLKAHYSEGSAHLHLGNTSAGYSDIIAGLEGFSRVLWGLAPLTAGGMDLELWEIYLEGIKNGTNPFHEEYWGQINDYDQRIVEMAAMGLAIALVPEKIWEPLDELQKKNFGDWLFQINDHKSYDCNWLFFGVIVNIGLKSVGARYDAHNTANALNKIDEFYIGDGWYSDGINGHSDYYVPFAMHYYGLVYSKLMEKEDPERSKLYRERAAIFAKDFIYWFSEDGSALPYGRSLTYRFAQNAFWGALAFADVDVFSPGVIKGIILRNLRWWFKQPIFDANGILTIGYTYPNLIMAENYNSPGSPYWALKSFLPLCLEETHPFWSSEEEPLPTLKSISIQETPHLILCRNEKNDNLMAFNTGHLSTNEHTHAAPKYEKFVYSNNFGFSVQRAEWGLSQGAFDSMLALSEEDNIYRVKRFCEEYEIHESYLFMRWKPWRDVEVRTFLVFGSPWHYRVHFIDTARSLNTAEGGFALGIETDRSRYQEIEYELLNSDNGITIKSPCGNSGIFNLYGQRNPKVIFPNSNTNIIASRTAIPTLTSKLEIGRHCLVSAVFGDIEKNCEADFNEQKSHVEIIENELHIFSVNKDKLLFRKNLNY
jgi:hypothetical protein